jgi:hypothetical protein
LKTGLPGSAVGRRPRSRQWSAPEDAQATHLEQCDFPPGAPNNCKLTGGTGKFENLQAALIITSNVVKSDYDGIGQVVGHKKGTYKIVKTN